MPNEHINLPNLFSSLEYGFSRIVTSHPGRMIFMSGQVGWDADHNLVGRGDLKAQTFQALRNIETALDAVEATMADIVSMRLYIVDYPSQDAKQIVDVLQIVFEGVPPLLH